MTTDALRYRIARALYNEGASCGECRSYSGWDSCDECRRLVLGLADEVLAVLADADPTDLADALAALGHQPRPGRGSATQREPVRITTAWASYGDDAPWLIAAYDEITAEEHNGEPDFYSEAVARSSDFMVREVILTVDFDAIRKAFDTPVVEAHLSEPPRPCPAGHGVQCCGDAAACEAALTGSKAEEDDSDG